MSDQFWAEAFNDNTFGDLKPYKRLGKDGPQALAYLLDGDIVAYRAAAPCDGRGYAIIAKNTKAVLHEERYKREIMKAWHEGEFQDDIHEVISTKNPEPEAYAIYNVDKIVEPILARFPDAWIRTYLTGNTNFRSQVFDEYKANRKNTERPVHLSACKQHLLNKYHAIMKDFHEADDLMGIEAMRLREQGRKYMIGSIDKDLNCIPGDHDNFVKGETYTVTEEEALNFFYRQCLMGDTVDNIPGIKGIGPKKSEKILKECRTPEEYYTVVLKEWHKFMPTTGAHDTIVACNTSAELLWILQEEGVMWTPPIPMDEAIKIIQEERDAMAQ
jgi:hypothetical protein